MIRAPADALEIFLRPGEFYFGEDKTRIRTLLGSCVAITLWHPRLHLGGMCHYMLPHRLNRRKDEPLDGRYADESLEMFAREIRRKNTRPADYQAKIFGGGRMFTMPAKAGRHVDISERNVQIGRKLVARAGFNLISEDLGGSGHRNVVLDLWSGDVWVKRVQRVHPIDGV